MFSGVLKNTKPARAGITQVQGKLSKFYILKNTELEAEP
jgi:hypothetical protein